jgi:hypothetical protein
VVSTLNVRFEFGQSKRSKKDASEGAVTSQCLIKVFAAMPIKAGEELVADYGDNFWK